MNLRVLAGLGLCLALQLFGCATDQAAEPTVADPNFPDIDPDQKALPMDAAGLPESKPVTDVTLDGAGGPISNGGDTAGRDMPPPGDEPAAQEPVRPSGEPTGSGSQKRYIKAYDLNIRSEPNRFSKIVGSLKGGDEVHVTIKGGWAKLDEGRWIRSRWLVKTRPDKYVGGPSEKALESPKKKTKRSKKSKSSRKKRD